jgi:chromosomal replication initiator protein
LQDIWQDALAVIRDSVPVERFNLWFRNTELIAQDETSCHVGVPNAFVGDWLQEHYSDVVGGALGSLAGREMRVRFVVSPELYRTSRQEELRQKQLLVEALDASLPRNAPVAPESGKPYHLADFVVGPSNRLAFAAAQHVAELRDGSLNPLVVHGPVGLGKTHILKGIVNAWNEHERGSALFMSAESFTNQFLAALQHDSLDAFHGKFENIELFALDDLQFLADKPATQDEFLQIYNGLANRGTQVVLASSAHPKDLPKLTGALATRLMSGMIARLDAPEYETRLAALRSKLGARAGMIDDAVLAFVAENVRGSIRELEGAATTLVATATLAGEKIDLGVARRVVAALLGERYRHVDVEQIAKAVAKAFTVTVEDIFSTRRHKSIALPRHVAMYLSRELTSLSWKEIGARFGRHNHTGALFAWQKIRSLLQADAVLAERVGRLRNELGG